MYSDILYESISSGNVGRYFRDWSSFAKKDNGGGRVVKGLRVSNKVGILKIDGITSRSIGTFGWEMPSFNSIVEAFSNCLDEAQASNADFDESIVFNKVLPTKVLPRTLAIKAGDTQYNSARLCSGFRVFKENNVIYVQHINSRNAPVSMTMEIPSDKNIVDHIRHALLQLAIPD